MPVAGLVVTFVASERTPLLASLAETRGISIGEPCGVRLPLVVEAESPKALDAAMHELGSRPGVLLVELAFAELSNHECLVDYEPPRRVRSRAGGDDGPT